MQFQMQFFHFLMKLRNELEREQKKRAAGFFFMLKHDKFERRFRIGHTLG